MKLMDLGNEKGGL